MDRQDANEPSRTGRRPWLAWTVAGIAAIVMIGGLAGIKTSQIMAAIAYGASFPEPSEAVIEAVAERRAIAPTARAIGEVQAKNIVDLRIERSGVIRAVNFQSGEEVAANAVLVQIDVAEEEAQRAAAEVDSFRANREAARQQKLFSDGTGTESRLQEAQAQAAAARARVAALTAAIDRKTIRAPFAGRVGITDLQPGQYVSEGDLVTSLVGLDPEIYVDFALPQAAALAFDASQPVEVTIGTQTVAARIIAREPAIDPVSRSLGFRAIIETLGARPPAGSLVQVSAPTGPPEDTVVIPRTALKRSPYGDTVYILEDREGETRARAVIVRTGDIIGSDDIVIRSGLEAGARIAADGVFKLRDGGLVSPSPRGTGAGESRGPDSLAQETR